MKNEMADNNNVVEKIADRVGWERSGRARLFVYPTQQFRSQRASATRVEYGSALLVGVFIFCVRQWPEETLPSLVHDPVTGVGCLYIW